MDWVLQALTVLVGAAAVYGGIRSDLGHLHRRLEETHLQTEQAHSRITDHIEHFHARR